MSSSIFRPEAYLEPQNICQCFSTQDPCTGSGLQITSDHNYNAIKGNIQKDSFVQTIPSFHESKTGGANLVSVERGIIANLYKSEFF